MDEFLKHFTTTRNSTATPIQSCTILYNVIFILFFHHFIYSICIYKLIYKYLYSHAQESIQVFILCVHIYRTILYRPIRLMQEIICDAVKLRSTTLRFARVREVHPENPVCARHLTRKLWGRLKIKYKIKLLFL